MSNIGSKIEKLIADGFSYNTLRGLSEAQVNLLYNRLVEQTAPPNTEIIKKNTTTYKVKPNAKTMIGNLEIDTTGGSTKVTPMEEETLNVVDDPDATEDGMGMFESEISEKFESKKQQKYFWWKCNSSKSEKAKKKWCKWAEEFSKDTNFKKLPEKKRDVKKIEESLTKLIENRIPQSITKKNLMDLIESSTRTKEAPTKTPTKTPTKSPGKGNPFKIPTPAQKPGPKAEVKEGGSSAPAKAPTKTPTKTPTKSPGKGNPFKIPTPAQKPGPKMKAPSWLSYNAFINSGYKLI